MKKLILLLVIGNFISCKNNSDLKEVEFFFAPSFLYPTKFKIDIKHSTIEQYTFQDSYYVKEWIDSTSYREHRKDTLVVHYKKTFKIKKAELNQFLSELKLSHLDSTVEHRRSVLDGIGFRVNKINSRNDTISLTSINPSRTEEFQMDYKLLDAFFDLSYKSIDDYDGISGIENIQDYFNYGLPLRIVNENPIEYRIWGSISGCRDDNQEFLRILESLPNDKPVIFDLRNGSIAYCLNEVLEEYSQKKHLYIYGDKSALQSKKIMDEIKLAEKNGKVLSELRIQAYETHKMIYENWKNNQKIKSFLTKEELLKTIANKE